MTKKKIFFSNGLTNVLNDKIKIMVFDAKQPPTQFYRILKGVNLRIFEIFLIRYFIDYFSYDL
jgi:hypothetical protein